MSTFAIYTKDDGLLYFKNGYLEYRLSETSPSNPTSSVVKPSQQGPYSGTSPSTIREITDVDLTVEAGKTYNILYHLSINMNNGVGDGVVEISLGGTATAGSVDLTFSAPSHSDVGVSALSNAGDQFELTVPDGQSRVATVEGTVTFSGAGYLRPYFRVLSPNITNIIRVDDIATNGEWLEHL